jgi:hypothetical protein
MAIKLKTGNSTWSTLKKVFAKTGNSTWSPITSVFAKLSTGWQKIWPGNAPAVSSSDPIDIRLTSYNGAVASSPQYMNTKLYGNDGSFTGTTPIIIDGRKMRVADDGDGNGSRYVVENSDIFDMSTATPLERFYVDGWYLFYELTASNIDGELEAFSPAIKIIKRVPQFSGVSLDGTIDIGQQLTFSFTAQNFYYNSPDYLNSYVRWWRNTSKVPGGTILKTDDLYDVNRVGTAWGDGYQNSPTSITANSTYNVQSADVAAGTYVIAELVLVNSYHDHFGGSTGTYISSGDAPVVESVYFRDNNNNDGFDNSSLSPYFQPKLPVATSLTLKADFSGVTLDTTYRVRYRIYNSNTGVYWRPFDQTSAASGTAAWQTYTPSVSFSGGSSVITDYFNIDSTTFPGGTYGGGTPTWELEIEVSAVRPGFARVYGDPIFQYISYSLGRTSVPSIVATPSSGGSPLLVTFSGQITAFPAGNAYPRAYRINYGDGQISSWQTFATNSANPTYSNTYTYNSQGTFTASIETWPSFTTDSDTVTVVSVPNAPTSLTATTARSDGVFLTWNSVPGANYYEIYWGSSLGGGPVNQSSFADFGTDNSITTNSFLDTTISVGSTRYYRVRARSSATASGVNNSNWFPGPGDNGIAGTRAQTLPGLPTSLTATTNRTDGVNLTFSGSSLATGYDIFWNTSQSSTPSDSAIPDFTNQQSPFLDTTISIGVTRWYWVRGRNSNGVGPWFPVTNGVTGTRVGSPPTGGSVSVNPNTGTAGSTTYTASASGWDGSETISYTFSWQRFTNYVYQYQELGTGTTFSPTVAQNSSALAWAVFVTASNGISPNGTASTSFTVNAPVSKLATPTGVNATDTRTDGVNVTWNAVSGAAYYGVWYGPAPSYDSNPDFGGPNNPTLITGTSYLDTAIGAGVTRDYYVQAFSSGNPTGTKSDWGGPNSGTRVAALPIPSTPAGLTATTNRTTDVFLSWSASSNATTYEIWWGGVPSDSSTPDFYPGSATYYFDNQIPQGSTRTYYVRARNASGASPWSGGVTGTRTSPAVVVNPPSGLSINLSYSGGPTWTGSWSATGATSYSWSFYTADNNSGTNVTFRSSGSGTSMSYSGGSQLWGKVYVTATNSGGSVSGESGWT